jgi:serine/threonine protein phosphatase PrpC
MNPIILGQENAVEPISLTIGNLEVAAFSHPGFGYSDKNDDRALILPEKRIFLISDGLGSANGEAASILVIEAIIQAARSNTALLVTDYLDHADAEIRKTDPQQRTLACASIVQIEENGQMEGAYSGDVEIGITTDQGHMQNATHQASWDPDFVTSCVAGPYKPSTIQSSVAPQHSLILASDGVTRNIPIYEIVDRLHALEETPMQTIQWIYDKCREKMLITATERAQGIPRHQRAGKCDNMSAILVRRN